MCIIAAGKTTLFESCDTNAGFAFWDSLTINERGESPFYCTIDINLSACNMGSAPTFHFLGSENCNVWEEILDITLLTNSETFRKENYLITVEYFSA